MAHCSNFWSRFQGASSAAASSVLPLDVHCNFGRITGLWDPVSRVVMSVVYIFILLTPTQEQPERICAVTWIFSNMEIAPQIFLGVCCSCHCCCEVPFIFTHWWNLVSLWLLRLSIFENKKFLLFDTIFVISWLEHQPGNWDELSVMTTPFLFLTSSSSHIMPCLGLGRNPGVWWIILSLRWSSLSGASPPKRGKRCQGQSIPGLGSFFPVAYTDDRFFQSCLSAAVIPGDEGGPIHAWPLMQGMNSVFAAFMDHPNPPAKILAQK